MNGVRQFVFFNKKFEIDRPSFFAQFKRDQTGGQF
jgi:hypothetical protein